MKKENLENLEKLKEVFSEEEAREMLRLTENYDKYLLRFKSKMDKLLESQGYEVFIGLQFRRK